jgi:hypothetical protein
VADVLCRPAAGPSRYSSYASFGVSTEDPDHDAYAGEDAAATAAAAAAASTMLNTTALSVDTLGASLARLQKHQGIVVNAGDLSDKPLIPSAQPKLQKQPSENVVEGDDDARALFDMVLQLQGADQVTVDGIEDIVRNWPAGVPLPKPIQELYKRHQLANNRDSTGSPGSSPRSAALVDRMHRRHVGRSPGKFTITELPPDSKTPELTPGDNRPVSSGDEYRSTRRDSRRRAGRPRSQASY